MHVLRIPSIALGLALAATALLATAPLAAQPALTGPEFYVDTPSHASGLFQGTSAAVADATGRLLVAWTENVEAPRVRGRLFDAAGKPTGPVLSLGDGGDPTLSPAAPDGFLLTWRTHQWDGHVWRIRLCARRLSSSGRPRGDAILVRQLTTPSGVLQLWEVQAAAASDGSFVVVWSETEASRSDVFLRRFDAAGRPLSSVARLPRDGGNDQRRAPALAVLAGGEIRIAWRSWTSDTGPFSLWLRRFDKSGVPLAAAVRLMPASVDAWNASVTFGPDGGWLAIAGPSFRAFTPGGAAFPEHPAPPLAFSYHVAAERGGTFLISWYVLDSPSCILAGLQVEADGTPRGPQGCLANPSTIERYSSFLDFSLAGTVEGGFVLLWSQVGHNGEPGYVYRLYGQRLATAAPGTLQIERARSAVPESAAGPLELHVLRRDGTAGPVSVDYALSGAASGSGTVTFSDGDSTPQVVPIPVSDDAVPGNDRTVRIVLGHPTGGALLGSTKQATVEIRDDDAPSPLLALAEPLIEVAHGNADDGLWESGLSVSPGGEIQIAWGFDHRIRYSQPERHTYAVRAQRFDAAVRPEDAFDHPMGVLPGRVLLAMHPAGDAMAFWQTGGDWRTPDEGTAGFAQRLTASGAADGQVLSLSFPAAGAAPLPGLRYVAVGNGNDAAGPGLFLHILSGGGLDRRTPVLVSRDPLEPGAPAVVATDSTGRSVVVWAVAPVGNGPSGIFARRFAASGSPLGPAFRVSQETGHDLTPCVAMDARGDFAVAWQRSWDGSGTGIYTRSFNAAGAPLSDEIPVNSATEGDQTEPAIALAGDGRFAVLWRSASGGGVSGQLFTGAGKRLGSEAQLGAQGTPAIAWSGKGFFAAAFWTDQELAVRRLPL